MSVKLNFSILFIFIFSLVLLFWTPLYSQVPFYESEPNDDFKSANKIPEKGCIEGFLQEGNADCFFWEVSKDGPQIFDITLEPARDSDPMLEVFSIGENFAEKCIIKSDMRGFGVIESISWLKLEPGYHYIRITGTGTNIKKSYILTLARSSGPENLETEPNDTTYTAHVLKENTIMWASLIPGDKDFFGVNKKASSCCVLSFKPFDKNQSARLSIDILTSGGDFLKSFENISIGYLNELKMNVSSTSLIIAVRSASKQGVKYSIEMSYIKQSDDSEIEFNDLPAHAFSLLQGLLLKGEAFPASDVDWFSFNPDDDTEKEYKLSVYTQPSGFNNFKISFPGVNIEKSFSVTGSTREVTFVLNKKMGPLFIMFSADSAGVDKLSAIYSEPSSEYVKPMYTIRIQQLSKNDNLFENSEKEINDFFSNAPVINSNSLVKGSVDGPDDLDYFLLKTHDTNVFDLRLNVQIARKKIKVDPRPDPSSLVLLPGSVTVYMGIVTENGDTSELKELTLYPGEVTRKTSLKFFNLVKPSYFIKIFSPDCNDQGLSYSFIPKIWEIKKSSQKFDTPYELTFFVPASGYDFVVFGTASNEYGRYFMEYHPATGESGRFIGQGKLFSGGLFFNQNRFARPGFYTVKSELPVFAAGINKENLDFVQLSAKSQISETALEARDFKQDFVRAGSLDPDKKEIKSLRDEDEVTLQQQLPAFTLFEDYLDHAGISMAQTAKGSLFSLKSRKKGFPGFSISALQTDKKNIQVSLVNKETIKTSEVNILDAKGNEITFKSDLVLDIVVLNSAALRVHNKTSSPVMLKLNPLGREKVDIEIKAQIIQDISLAQGKVRIILPEQVSLTGFILKEQSRLGFLSFPVKEGDYLLKCSDHILFSPCFTKDFTKAVVDTTRQEIIHNKKNSAE